MISGIRQDKIPEILQLSKSDPEDEKTTKRLWKRNFLICGIMTLAAAAVLAMNIVLGKLYFTALFILFFVIALDGFVVYKYYYVKVTLVKRFNSAISKYGREVLAAQLSDTAAFGFFVDDSDNYESLLILTMDYLIEAGELIVAFKDIRELTLKKADVNEEYVARLKSEHLKSLMRCAYKIEIKLVDGSQRSGVAGIATSDLNAFFAYLNQRAPHISATYK